MVDLFFYFCSLGVCRYMVIKIREGGWEVGFFGLEGFFLFFSIYMIYIKFYVLMIKR